MELSVDLRLAIEKLKADVAKASAVMKGGLGVGSEGVAKETNKAGTSMDNLEKKVKKTTQALKDQKKAALDAWRASLPEPKISDNSQSSSTGKKYGPGATIPMTGAGLATSATLTPVETPKPSITKPPVIPSAPAGGGGGKMGSIQAAATASGIPMLGQLIRTAMNPAVIGVSVSLLAMRKAIRETAEAFENARRTYAKQLQSGGLPGGFIQKRAVLADIIGVGESEVMQFGSAVTHLNEKIRIATRELSETNRTLTAASWNIKAMQVNFRAIWAQFAEALSPVVNKITTFVSAALEFLVVTGRMGAMGTALNAILTGVANAVGLVVVAISGLHLAFQSLVDSIQWVAQQINNLMAKWKVPTFTHDAEDKFKQTKEGAAAIGKMIDSLLGRNRFEQSPNATTGMRRMEHSPWEKMGLVIGNGPGTNYAKDTAKNTKEIVNQIGNFLQRAVPSSGMNQSPVSAQP